MGAHDEARSSSASCRYCSLESRDESRRVPSTARVRSSSPRRRCRCSRGDRILRVIGTTSHVSRRRWERERSPRHGIATSSTPRGLEVPDAVASLPNECRSTSRVRNSPTKDDVRSTGSRTHSAMSHQRSLDDERGFTRIEQQCELPCAAPSGTSPSRSRAFLAYARTFAPCFGSCRERAAIFASRLAD